MFRASEKSSDSTVKLIHAGQKSPPVVLRTATAAQIAAVFDRLQDDMYSGLVVSSIQVTTTSVTWTLELTTPWASCNSPPPPLLGAECGAKVMMNVVQTEGGSCLGGGLDVSLVDSRHART